MPIGVYISVPFCRSKCSYCNFASGVFSRERFERYVGRVAAEIAGAEAMATRFGCELQREADSLYLGGGTPTALKPAQLRRLFAAVREAFTLVPGAEITVECAPGTLSPEMPETLVACGVNRASLGVQSFVDAEAAAVGRLHTRAVVEADIAGLRAAGITNINIDLIAGLPHQTAASWAQCLAAASDSGVPHVSVYMLEVDEDSRLGRELIAGGTRYHAHFVPDEDATADFYLQACEELGHTGIAQYEISNFARSGMESRHNLKYWTREPYLGFGVDAHSMLRTRNGSVRLATSDDLDSYLAGAPLTATAVTRRQALEESFFLGLRLNRGVDLEQLAGEFGEDALAPLRPAIREACDSGLLELRGNTLRLTPRGRLLSNEVFSAFLVDPEVELSRKTG